MIDWTKLWAKPRVNSCLENQHPAVRGATHCLAVAVLGLVSLSSFSVAEATSDPFNAQTTFNIPAQPLSASLKQLANQAGIEILFEERVVSGRQAPAVEARETPLQALTALLKGTGLEFTAKDRTIAVRKKSLGTANYERGGSAGSDSEQNSGQNSDQQIQLEEIIVTAQKRSENLQNVPLSVGTISGQALKTYGEMHLTDFAAGIPGLSVESAYGVPGSVSISIRGISTADTDNTPTVATYIDDIPVSASGENQFGNLIGPDLFTYDIDHVEVLKGPQGTLYGASSLGGLLKYVTRTPDLNEASVHVGESAVAIEHSPNLGWGLNGAANLPLIPGELALSISAAHACTPGYIDNVATGDRGFNHGVEDGARMASLLETQCSFERQIERPV